MTPASWSCASPSRTLRWAKAALAWMTPLERRGARMVSRVRIASARTPRPSRRRSRKAKLIGSCRRGGWDLPEALSGGRANPCRENAGSSAPLGAGSVGKQRLERGRPIRAVVDALAGGWRRRAVCGPGQRGLGERAVGGVGAEVAQPVGADQRRVERQPVEDLVKEPRIVARDVQA